MPAEWVSHEATWLTWPKNQHTWPPKRLMAVEEIYLEIISSLLPAEKVNLLVDDPLTQDKVIERLQKHKVSLTNFKPHILSTVDAWIRDYGPTFIVGPNGQKAWIKWNFNGWGHKYKSQAQDNSVFENPADLIPHKQFKPWCVLEGGALEVNGEGTCLVTEASLLNPNRNKKMTKSQMEEVLRDYLNISQVIWMDRGIAGDDTDGHIDDMIRFVNPTTILTAFEEDKTDINCAPLQDNWNRLQISKRPGGEPWNTIKLPMPSKVAANGIRLPASYANFYIANEVVLVPVYSDPNDKEALRIINDCFPTRKIISIVCNDLIYGLGSIHCITQQEPL